MDQPRESDKDLINFLTELVNNPAELRRYRQNPDAYLASKATHLPQDTSDMLTKLQLSEISSETSTVFRIETASQPKDTSGECYPLTGKDVILSCPTGHLIAETTNNHPLECSLSAHSYMITERNNEIININVTYMNPDDHRDVAWTFNIHTPGAKLKQDTYNLSEHKVKWTIISVPLTIPFNKIVTAPLQEGSCYHLGEDGQITTLCLIFTKYHDEDV